MAIRITRPYATEDAFLEQELETLSRTSVTLLGAQPRPQGVVLRFELVLSSGSVLMRGEGRVVGFRPNAHQGLGGLTLRFTRLDSRSKALVDCAAAVRERRRPASMMPPPSASVTPPEPPISEPAESRPVVSGVRTSERPLPAPPLDATPALPPPVMRSERPPAPQLGASRAVPGGEVLAPPPPGREEVLARLRSRGQGLEPGAIERILQQRKRQA